VPADALKDGINTVTVSWPLSAHSFSSQRESKKITTPKELIEAISPVFGEIHQFTAQIL
jgi:hypothetical protein